MKKILSTFISLLIMISTVVPASATTETLSDDIVVLYTNDVHTYIDGALSYDVIAAIKDELQKQYKYVFLADAGDHIQGTAYGSMDKGESIIKLMNAAEYDIATLGNHEFDYGMSGCLNVIDIAEFPYVSANFYHEKDGVRGENVLDSFAMLDCGEEKLAIVGITTPETFSKSTPAYFQDENGGFLHVSGLTYKVDTTVANTTKADEMGTWLAGPDSYRVHDMKVYNKETNTYEVLDVNASYNLAGYNYTLRDLGDGYAMFDGAVNVLDYVMEDYMVLANYVQGFEDGVVGANNSPLIEKYPGLMIDYSTVNGSGRIEIGDISEDFKNSFEDVDTSDWYYGDVKYAVVNGLMNGVTESTFAPNSKLTRAMLVTVLYRNENEPATNKSIAFADVDMSAYYANAVSWAKQNGIVNGITENEFAPDDSITRAQIAAIIHRYATYKGYDVSVGENTNILSYDDYSGISEYAIASMQYAVGSGLMKGKTEGTLNPQDNATRAEAAAILHRFIR